MKINHKISFLLGSFVLLGLVSCKDDKNNSNTDIAEKIPGIVLENMDRTVSQKTIFTTTLTGLGTKPHKFLKKKRVGEV